MRAPHTTAVFVVLVVAAACGGSGTETATTDPADIDPPSTADAAAEPGASEADAGEPVVSTVPPTTAGSAAAGETIAAPADPEWIAVAASAIDDFLARERASSDALGELYSTGPDTRGQIEGRLARERERADHHDGLAVALPSSVPDDVSDVVAALRAASAEMGAWSRAFADDGTNDLDAWVAEIESLRALFADADVRPPFERTAYGARESSVGRLQERWWAACLDLASAAIDAGGAPWECDAPEEPFDEPDPSIEPTELVSDALPLPAGSHTLTYTVRPVELNVPEVVLVRSTAGLVELSPRAGGPVVRIHLDGVVADPAQLGVTITNPSGLGDDGAGPWIEALPSEVIGVDGEGSGSIGGVSSVYWDLTNRSGDAIAILGGGFEEVPDTILLPGDEARVWQVEGAPTVVIAELLPSGADRDGAVAELAPIYEGLTFP